MQDQPKPPTNMMHFIGDNMLWGIDLPYFVVVPDEISAENMNFPDGTVPVMAPPRVKQIVANDTDNQTDAKVVRLFGK